MKKEEYGRMGLFSSSSGRASSSSSSAAAAAIAPALDINIRLGILHHSSSARDDMIAHIYSAMA